LLELGFAVVGLPLYGTVVPIAHGPASGLRIRAERRSLAWISGRVEGDVQRVLTAELAPGGVFIDVGASIGFFSLLAARIVGSDGTVIAFEPQPPAAASIRDNAALNGFTTVTVVESALSSRPGRVALEDVGKATAHVVESPRTETGTDYVEALSLDAYLAERPRIVPDVVKIDVEGHEVAVLAGMRATLSHQRPLLLVECHGQVADVVAELERAQYSAGVVGSDTRAAEAPPSAHLVARPAGA
jgi:FkbM family methyltransferase